MKIFILDRMKIIKFNLPDKIEDSFLIPYTRINNKEEISITIEAKDHKWHLKSNGSANVMNDKDIIDNVALKNYNSYSLKILGQEEVVTLFVLPSKETETYNLSFKNLKTFTIGSSTKCNISYNNSLTATIQAEIKFVNNDWYIASSSDEKYYTYVNGNRILSAKLNVGDVIFINGLKIIWMKSFIKINNPHKAIKLNDLEIYKELGEIDNSKYTPVSDEDSCVELYDENDYFYHVPRLVPVIDVETIDIDSPPGNQAPEEIPFLLTLGMSVTLFASSGLMIYNIVNNLMAGRSIKQLIPQMIMCFSMLVGGIIMPRILRAYHKRKRKKREKERQTKYKAYLDKKETEIQYALKQQSQILKENNLTIKECCNVILNKGRKLWLREIADEDFLSIRLGSGTINSYVKVNAPKERFTLDEDNLQEMAFEVDKKSKKLVDVPITIGLANQTVLSFIFDCSYRDDYINGLLTQILAYHSPNELKIAIFTNKQNESKWSYAKFLPHCWSDDKEKRFFATTLEECEDVASYLESQLKERLENLKSLSSDDTNSNDPNSRKKLYKVNPPYYLIITDDYKIIKNFSMVQGIQNSKTNVGFSIVTLSSNMKNLPNKCEKFVEIGEKESCILDKRLSGQSQIVFSNEYEKNIDMDAISVKLSNVPVLTKDSLYELPTSLSFLEMYRVSKIEQLNVFNRWQSNNPMISLSTPIGVHSDGEQFKLDLHEKFHGPHGLIAGTTGSGKSEFIITYILSMCINYHPYEVQFVLIDYKGGGLAGAFENKDTGVKIPHLVGTITNLDTAEMNRTLVSISSEITRRQRKFNEVKDKLNESTMDIYKYQKFYREGLIDEPMSHLFIISDEFAELKSQLPEFLSELVSIARIGRSLGVHLILATQKPSGIVSDQIWSNSKFKVCLKVQTRADSMEMLKRPDAASIKEAGRFFLQIGHDEYFDIGQAGWSGAKYVPTDKIIKKFDDSIAYIDNTGNVIKSINDISKKETNVELGEQLTNIVKYIYNLSQKENINTRNLWLEKIPDIIYLNQLKQKYNYKPIPFFINPVIGEYDNPINQSQGILNLDLTKNTLIYGKSGSGKENLLTTVLWSSIIEHTPQEINFYVIDCGAETLKMFNKMPHVGDIMIQEEREKIIDTFNMLASEIERRKEEYSEYAGNYENYCENSGKKDPLIVTIINNYEVFVECFSKLSEQIQGLYRDGEKYGVTFVISCLAANSIRSKMLQLFSGRIALQMPNRDDYRSVLSAPRGLVPANVFGRGLMALGAGVFEFQTAIFAETKQVNNVIKETAKKLNEAYKSRAKRVPTIPEIVTAQSFGERVITLQEFPLGFNIFDKEVLNCDLLENSFYSMVSETMSSRVDFVRAFIKQLNVIPNVNVKIIDFVKAFSKGFGNVPVYAQNFDGVITAINNEIANENKSNKINYYIFIGAGEIENELGDAGKQILNNLFKSFKAIKKSHFIFVDDYASFKSLQLTPWYKSATTSMTGIWLGTNLQNQMIFPVPNVNMDIRRLDFPCMGFVINKDKMSIMKYFVDMEGQDEK